MSAMDWIQILVLIGFIALVLPFLGIYMKKVFFDGKSLPVLKTLENFTYKFCGIDSTKEMGGKSYLKALLLFNFIGFIALFLILIFQNLLPFNPENLREIPWTLALNIAISFTTNTNWQSYAPEITLSHGAQMLGLTVQNFLSAATGIAVLLALTRGVARKTVETIGNFWSDIVRVTIYLLIPLSIIFSLFLVSQGVVQTLSPNVEALTIEQETVTIPLGPAASQVAIKQLGSNGGGFFNTNSSHPFENPNSLTNFFELVAILLIPASLTYMYELIMRSKRHALILLLTMFLIWAGGVALSLYSETLNNPIFNAEPLLEGKETRLGVVNSILWSVSTTTTSNGSINAMADSLSPIAGGVALFNIMLGEIIFGGVGVGLCSMLMFVFLTVFMSGLMVGRTPVYMSKRIEKSEMQWVSIAILTPSALILIGSAVACAFDSTLASIKNFGPHGLTEILYAFSSASGNNGSAFAGLNSNTDFYNITLAIFMLLGRLSIIIPSIAIASSLAKKKTIPLTSGVFSTSSFLFLPILLGVILIVEALTFFPALSLGPIVEHLLMLRGQTF